MKDLAAKRIEEGLKRYQMKPIDLAKASGVSRASLSQYINGLHTPNTTSARKIANVLGGDPLWYMGYDDVPFSHKKQDQIVQGMKNFTEDQLQAVLNLVDFINEQNNGNSTKSF